MEVLSGTGTQSTPTAILTAGAPSRVGPLPEQIFEIEEKLPGRCVCPGAAVQVHRWLREKPIGEQTR
jgi:hypothetical protein